MRSKPASCLGCSCHDMGRDFSMVEGTGSNGVLLVGEASGAHEQRDQLPFRPYADSGAVLTRCLNRMTLSRQQFALTNVCRCRPRNNWLEGAPWEYSAIRHCRPNLDAAIQQYRPRCIVALGGVALRELTGEAGEQRGVTHLAGYVLPLAGPTRKACPEPHEYDGKHHPDCLLCSGSGFIEDRGLTPQSIPVIADFHPSYIRRGKASYQGVFSRILHRALNIAAGSDRQFAWDIDPDDPTTWRLDNNVAKYALFKVPTSAEINEPQVLSRLQSGIYAFLSQSPSADAITEVEKQLSELRPSLLEARQATEEALRRLREYKQSDASSRLQSAIAGGVAVPSVSSQIARPSKLEYFTNPTLDQAWSVYHYLRDNQGLVFAKDIETSESSSIDEDAREGFSDTEVRLFQLSYQPGTGIAIPYVNGFKQVVQEILRLPHKTYGHNWDNFDHKVLRACAAREGWKYVPTTRVFDTLDMFHHWQPDLPAHLQFCSSFINFPFPWKHLAATNIEFYGICDVDADLQLGTYLETVLKKDNLWGEREAYSLTTGYTGQEREVRPVLARMEDRGMPIDDAARLKLGAEFMVAQRTLGAELAERAPEACRRVHPKEGYKGVPPEVKAWIKSCAINIDKADEFADWDELAALRFQDPKPVDGKEDEWEGEWYTYQRKTFDIPTIIHIAVEGEQKDELASEKVERWCRVYDFNPNSAPQLLTYMKSKSHKVPKSKIEDAEGNQKDTTAAKELQRLAVKTGDDFYLKVIEYRGLTKLRGTYVDGFRPSADGCVHTTFTFATSIGQLSSRNPNCQNFPKLKPTPALAKAMRAMVCAKEGRMLTEIDFKSCHVITLGLLAGDENYTRLGRLDIHSAVAGHFLGHWNLNEIIKETDDELMQRFRWLKSDPERKRVRDDQAKHGILGIGNGLRAKGLYERYMESFPPRSCPACVGSGKVAGVRGLRNCSACKGTGKQSGLQIAEAVLSTCEALFPKVFEFQEAQRQEAHAKHKLTNPFGHMRRFYEVYRWDHKKNDWGHGDQAEEAVAYRLASIAHCHMREVMKELDRNGMAERYWMFNQIHDALKFHHLESDRENILRDVIPVMTAASKVLPGLWLGVEASQGRRWSEMKTVELPTIERQAALV